MTCIDAGAGDDNITTVGGRLTDADTIDGGGGTDTITLSADSATIVDADFTNIENVEGFTTADGANNVTLGTKADDSGLATITTGSGMTTSMPTPTKEVTLHLKLILVLVMM